jgi:hypothetical protein
MNIVIALGILVTLVTGIPVLIQLLRQHPKGLIILFFAEMWERFSYYGMRAILIFYLTQHFLFDPKTASSHYGSYTSLVYLLPLIGGFLADKYLGTRKAVAFGAILLVAGHLTMAIEGKPAVQTMTYASQTYEIPVDGTRPGSASPSWSSPESPMMSPPPRPATSRSRVCPPTRRCRPCWPRTPTSWTSRIATRPISTSSGWRSR